MSKTAIGPLDESFGHQLVAPRAITEHPSERWAERTYYLLHVDETLTINAGRQLYRHAGRWATFSAAATPAVQDCLRANPAFEADDDPDAAVVGPLRIEVVEPLKKVRLILDEPDFPLSYDLTWEARFPPAGDPPVLIEKDGEMLTNTMVFFQSGAFSGTVVHDGVERGVQRRAGFRDRSWGVRRHDGAPHRGLVVFAGAEFEDESLYVHFLETGRGVRAHTSGFLLRDGGVADRVTEVEDELVFGESSLERGRLQITFASGDRRLLEFESQTRLFLPGVGYSPDPERKRAGIDRFDLTDQATVTALEGQTDHGSRFVLDGVVGNGYVETGRGTHPRYRPEA